MSMRCEMAGERLLVVDDNRAYLAVCRRALAREGYRLQTVDSGREALDHLRSDPPDLVVLDFSLRDFDGWGLLGHIARTHRDIPIILHSSFPCFGEFQSWAADAFVVKAADFRDLRKTIRRILDGEDKRPRRERDAPAIAGPHLPLPSPMTASEFAKLSVLSTLGGGAD
jgi:DNA-binding NtrC family response regulator